MTTDSRDAAFPFPCSTDARGETWIGQHGMTKREYFAGLALQSLLNDQSPQYQDMNVCARDAVEAADALIEALNK